MHLLHFNDKGELSLTKDLIEDIPRYAILSHTWGEEEDEVNFGDLKGNIYTSKAGYAKIEFCGRQAQADGLRYFWIDTCCIDKTSSAQLQEAITSMFSWYRSSAKCYVYLQDVSSRKRKRTTKQRPTWEAEFRNSRWFTRGWTLQELLAPNVVMFYSKEREYLGDKQSLKTLIHQITAIPFAALDGCPLSQFSIEDRRLWAVQRDTKRKEDKAYCLLGILDVSLLANYGEGEEQAFSRLEEEIVKHSAKTKLVLNNIPYAKGALYNSYEQCHTTCHPLTRLDILGTIQGWAQQPDSKSIFWLNGWAGTGKSTISTTIAQWLTAQTDHRHVKLGASFFFKRGEGDRGNASRFFPTIVRDLAQNVSGLQSTIAEVIRNDSTVFDKALGEQFDKLIYQPVRNLSIVDTRPIWVIVVDALDECESERDTKVILDLWSLLPQLAAVRLKLFLTSRPELPIRLGFKRMAADAHQDLILQDAVPQATIEHDIQKYLEDEFGRIRQDFNNQQTFGIALEEDWPGDQILQDLTNMAVPLFIVAATVCRLVGDFRLNPRTRLKHILDSRSIGTKSQMEQAYLPVLQQMMTISGDVCDGADFREQFRLVVGSMAVLAEPLAVSSLSELLNMPQDDICALLSSLHSVIRMPKEADIPVRFLHLSFSEFLLSENLKRQAFGVDSQATHLMLLAKCLELLSSKPHGLCENLCSLDYPGQPRRELDSNRVNAQFSTAAQYACRYWVHHAKHGGVQILDNEEVHVFLQDHFLHWLEALSLIGRLAEAIEFISTLQSLVPANEAELVKPFLEDAARFVLANRYIADLAPLQLYSSAVLFAPQNSIIRNRCGQIQKWVRTCPTTPSTWGAELQKLEGHRSDIHAMTFSPDGSLLASGAIDGTIVLWNATTGQELQQIWGGDWITALGFSHENRSLIASGSYNGVVKLWNINTGQEMQQILTGSRVRALAFGHASSVLTLKSDGTIRRWNVTIGQTMQAVEADGEMQDVMRLHQTSFSIAEATTLILSPDGALLASGFENGTIRLWNVNAICAVKILKGHTNVVRGLAFSFDGLLLVSASEDCTIRLWNVNVSQEVKMQRLKERPHTVALSPNKSVIARSTFDCIITLLELDADQQRHKELPALQTQTEWISPLVILPKKGLLAFGSASGTVNIWDIETLEMKQRLEGHTRPVDEVTYSTCESLLASASHDKTIRLWNICTGQEMKKFTGHTADVNTVRFSPNNALLASGSNDRTIRLWDVNTGQELHKIKANGLVMSVAFSSDGSLLAAGLSETVTLWTLNTGEQIHHLKDLNIDNSVYSLAFSPDRSLLITTFGAASLVPYKEQAIRLWSIVTGEELQGFDDLSDVFTISLSRDNKTIFTNQGILSLDKSRSNVTIASPIREVYINRQGWICLDGRNLLWLPQEYRAAPSAYHDFLFAFGFGPDDIRFIRLDPSKLDIKPT